MLAMRFRIADSLRGSRCVLRSPGKLSDDHWHSGQPMFREQWGKTESLSTARAQEAPKDPEGPSGTSLTSTSAREKEGRT